MALSRSELAGLPELVAGAASAREAAAMVRTRWPQLRVSVQDAFDLRGEVPAARAGALDVHLMANAGGCWRLTDDPDATAAIILVDRED